MIETRLSLNAYKTDFIIIVLLEKVTIWILKLVFNHMKYII